MRARPAGIQIDSRKGVKINWFTGILVYVIIWWVVIFAVLPWGVRVPDRHEPGHATSAPERPMLWRKALITSAIAAVLWVGVYFLVQSDLIPLRVTAPGGQ